MTAWFRNFPLRFALTGLAACFSIICVSPAGSTSPPGLSDESKVLQECRAQADRVYRTVDEVLMSLEGAQRSGDPRQLRSAIESTQTALADLKRSSALCSNLLEEAMRSSQNHPPPPPR
jgi:hypothetical protein